MPPKFKYQDKKSRMPPKRTNRASSSLKVPFRVHDSNLLRSYEEETSQERIPVFTFSTGTDSLPAISVNYAPKSHCRALEGFGAKEVVTLNFESVRLSPKNTKEFIMKRIACGLELKYHAVSKVFHFFGYSNSQIRARKVVMVQRSPEDIETLLESMGDFSMTSVAKRAKRIGLLFSSAKPTVVLHTTKVEEIADIKSGSGAVLTDGCGFISKTFAKRVVSVAKIVYRSQHYLPSVYQIRYAGYKGVVALHPTLPKEISLQCRPSMKKFKNASNHVFGLVEASKPYSFGALNSEHVTLLVEMGVDAEVLLQKQREYHEFLHRAKFNTEEAFQLLIYKDRLGPAERLLAEGLEEVSSQVYSAINHDLKKGVNKWGERKVRIVLLNSRLLFGVAEPESWLGVDEVFVRITINGISQTLTGGHVLVTRNPCLHPGDIRRLKCVDVEQYHHLVDCVVFSTNARLTRSHAEEMSGGDLDGDTFTVIFDSDITSCKMIFEPYEYPPAKEKRQGGINRKDRMLHFAGFNNSSVGRIKNLYLKWVAEKGARCREALELNALFSACVDGEFQPIPDRLLQIPEVSEASRNFIVNRLVRAAEAFVKHIIETELMDSSRATSYELLSTLAFESRSTGLSSFELFRFVQRCSNLDAEERNELCAGIDFSSFSFSERMWTIGQYPSFRAMTDNALYLSDVLPQNELRSYPFLELEKWKLLYTASLPGPAFDGRIITALCCFVRKLIVLQAGPRLKLVLFVNQRLEKGVNKLEILHVYSTSGTGFKSHVSLVGFELEINDHLVQIYRAAKRGTFVWMETRARDTEHGLVGRVSVDLRRLGNKAENHFELITKQPLAEVELYVLASEDSRALQIRHYPIGFQEKSMPSHSRAEILLCRAYRVEAEVDWLKSPTALPEIVDIVRNNGDVGGGHVDKDVVRKLLESSLQYNLHEITSDVILLYPDYASEAISFLDRLPQLAIPLFHIGRGEANLIFCSLLRCLSDRRYAPLAIECISEVLPKIDLLMVLEHMCLCSCISAYSAELRELVLTLFQTQVRSRTEEGASVTSNTLIGLGVFVDLQCTLVDAFRDNQQSPSLQYLHLEKMKDKEPGLFTAARKLSSPSVIPRRGDVFVFEAMQSPSNKPTYVCPPFVGILENILEDFTFVFDLKAACAPFEVDLADWNGWNIGNVTTSRAMWDALSKDHLRSGHIHGVEIKLSVGTNSMNESQTLAIKTALVQKVSLIWGPPAVGKTFTVSQLLRELVNRNERILVAASTHQAVDNILRKWVCAEKTTTENCLIPILRVGDLHQVDPSCHCWTVEMHPTMKEKNNAYQAAKASLQLISKARIVFCTATGAGLGMLRKDGAFDTVIVDEAGQLTCANTRIATCKAQKRVVLIGDHRQLRATVHDEARKIGSQESLFEKLHAQSYPCVMLDIQYRMHPSLIRFASAEFYDGKIESSNSVRSITPLISYPWSGKYHAVSVNVYIGREQRVGTSFRNEEEARLICQAIAMLVKSEECKACDIGVITGYSGQVKCLKDTLSQYAASSKEVSIRTVDGFQGQERQVIFFSAVRTGHHVGFLKDRHRMNVMLTRAKRGLAVFGKINTLQNDSLWAKWIKEHPTCQAKI